MIYINSDADSRILNKRIYDCLIYTDKIEPSSVQNGGIQGEHRATGVIFRFDYDAALWLKEVIENGRTFCRVDACDSAGVIYRSRSVELTESPEEFGGIYYDIEKCVTNNGGIAKITLVISQMSDEYMTECVIKSDTVFFRFTDSPIETHEEIGEMNTICECAKKAAAESKASALDSEAWAIGKRKGINVDEEDPAYQNNAKYYADRADDSAACAESSSQDAAGYKNGAQAARDAAEGYKNTAVAAATSATNAKTAAETAAASATASKVSAESSATNAAAAKTAAETAATNAGNAETAAESAQTAAENAKADAEAARDLAEEYKDDAYDSAQAAVEQYIVKEGSGNSAIIHIVNSDGTKAASFVIDNNNKARILGWKISEIDYDNKQFTLSGYTGGITAGDTYSCKIANYHNFAGTVTAISGNVITVDTMPGEETFSASSMLWLPGKPDAGVYTAAKGNAIFGIGNTAAADNNFVAGYNNKADAAYSGIFGTNNTGGYLTGIFGNKNKLYAERSFAAGSELIGSGKYLTMFGNQNTVTGTASFCAGTLNEIAGDFCAALGRKLKITHSYQTAVGKFNDETSPAMFVVGNGTAEGSRSNAFEVLNDGTIKFGSGSLKGEDGVALSTVETKRMLYRGKNLGSSLTAAQKSAISSGTFTDLYIGDYWVINGVNWRIADIDYFYGRNFDTHHLVIVPDTTLGTMAMYDTDITSGAYVGSNVYTALNDPDSTVMQAITGAFGNNVLEHTETLQNSADANGCYNGMIIADEIKAALMNQVMLYGSYVQPLKPTRYQFDAGAAYGRTSGVMQLALFRLSANRIPNLQHSWLRDVVSASQFAASEWDGATTRNSSTQLGVRPYFCIGV